MREGHGERGIESREQTKRERVGEKEGERDETDTGLNWSLFVCERLCRPTLGTLE